MTSRLCVTGAATPALLLRVVNLVAQHDLPLRAVAAEFGEHALTIRLHLGQRPGRPILERLRSLVEVSAVEWTEDPDDQGTR